MRECWLLIGHKKCFVSCAHCPIGEQHLLSSFRRTDALQGAMNVRVYAIEQVPAAESLVEATKDTNQNFFVCPCCTVFSLYFTRLRWLLLVTATCLNYVHCIGPLIGDTSSFTGKRIESICIVFTEGSLVKVNLY